MQKIETINKPVFLSSAALIISLSAVGTLYAKPFEAITKQLNSIVTKNFGWLLILSVSFFLFYILWLLVSRYSEIKLGKDDDEPEFSYWAWVAMLFSAGMGIGLLFWGVAEPVLHFASPPNGIEPSSYESARVAINIAYFHWGLHAWAIYAVVGLSIAYFHFRKKMPISIRSCFYPLLGEKIHGLWGHLIDILAILGTLFGVATSLGLGVMQINSGLSHLFPAIPQNTNFQIFLIVLITIIATFSVVSGLNVGIRILSEINLIFGLLLLLFIFIAGPTIFILNALVQSTGYFFQNIITTMFWTEAFSESGWLGSWTVFYWAWWISWSPFVGIFIARISKGRTIGEFILTVLFLPTFLSFAWFTVFGGSAIHLQLKEQMDIVTLVQENIPVALFEFLNYFPAGSILCVFAIIVVTTFFVTSSDSGSFVVDMIASGGHPNPPVKQKIFWASLEGLVAAALLMGGGLIALQTAAILTAIPFCIILILMCYSLTKALRREKRARYTEE